MPRVHPSSWIDPRASVADDVEIGPFCLVYEGVRIGSGTRLLSHVVVRGDTSVGEGNEVHPFVVLGGDAQVRAQNRRSSDADVSSGRLEIGHANVFREGVTVNRSSSAGLTRIGSNNLVMAGAHVAHDAVVGSHCVIANGVQLAGHVVLEDHVTFGGLSGVAQRVRVGESAFVAGGAMCERDVPPFVIVQGDRARVRAPNVVGLERRGVPTESIRALRRAVVALWLSGREGREASESWSFTQVLSRLDRRDPFVRRLVEWLEDPVRLVPPAARSSSHRS